ncbi:MAG TPA: EAL domain-containing protein, partial [Nitrosospira sp.]|nr:EAL domain-containing protein [Nitrosospira sp.]
MTLTILEKGARMSRSIGLKSRGALGYPSRQVKYTPRQIAIHIVLLAVGYFAGGKLGLALPYLNGEISANITLFWPPTGIALATLLTWGFSCWPGIYLGSIAINLTTGDLSVPAALAIGIGNTLAPVCAVFLLEQAARFQASFVKGRDVVSFMLFASGAMLISATGGTLSLLAGGKLEPATALQAWLGWWLGDILGVLIFAPLLLLWATRRLDSLDNIIRSPQLRMEFGAVVFVCILTTWLVFGNSWSIGPLQLSLGFLVFLPLIWAGLRFDALGASISTLIISLIAVWATARGLGPFARGGVWLDHVILCTFITTVSLVSLVIIVIQAARRQSEHTTKDSESRLRLALKAANQGLFDLDVRSGVMKVSPEYARMLGYDAETFMETAPTWLDRVHPDDREQFHKIYNDYIAGLRGNYQAEFRQYTRQGNWKWILSLGNVVEWDSHGFPSRMLGTHTDISRQKQVEEELLKAMEDFRASEKLQREQRSLAEREQSRMRALLSAMNIGILFEDNEHRIEYVNPAFLKMWGIGEHVDLVGKPTRAVLEQSVEYAARPPLTSKDILADEPGNRLELDLSNGRTLTQTSHGVSDAEGHSLGRLWIYEDITYQRQAAQQLLYMAERDPLTGLYNRHRFQEQLENMIASSIRNKTQFALLYFDLDDFKYINDTFGHRAGDLVLVRAAGEISSIVRHIEMFARVGGDEFAILSGIQPGEDISSLPARIVAAIASIPLQLGDTNVHLTSSVGVAIFPTHGETAEDLVAHADAAMYQAKNLGKNTWTMYDSARDSSRAMVHHMSWHNKITQALEKNLYELHFQGVFHAATSTLSHLEVLIRMRDLNDPSNLIMPGQFIPVAEKSKQILHIDRWVIRRSIELLGHYPNLPPLAINISGRTFDEPEIPQFIHNLLNEWNVSPNRLIIELTETAAVSDIQDAQRFIEAIGQTGCRVCLDDFGSGFSTFGYLKYLNAQILKIDGLFICNLPDNRDNQIFVKAMVEVARGLGKITVAECVEDAATL